MSVLVEVIAPVVLQCPGATWAALPSHVTARQRIETSLFEKLAQPNLETRIVGQETPRVQPL